MKLYLRRTLILKNSYEQLAVSHEPFSNLPEAHGLSLTTQLHKSATQEKFNGNSNARPIK